MKLILIDRDGVINEERSGYVTSSSELTILPHVFEAFALFKRRGFTCVVITNQSVVGRNIITLNQLNEIHEYLAHLIAKNGGAIADFFVCTDHPSAASYRRKPKPGMLIEAIKKYRVTPDETPMIGDARTDLEAAYAAGCPRYLVKTGKGQQTLNTLTDELNPVVVCEHLLDAALKIVERF